MKYLKDGMTIPSEVTIDCDSVDEFWEKIFPVGSVFGGDRTFRYRGQRLSTWALEPGIFRDEVAERVRTRDLVGMLADHPTQTWIEASLLHAFVEQCDVQGMSVPCDSPALRALLDSTPSRYAEDTANWPDVELRPLLALAQHHGVPTRLLDVSASAFVAAYFAAVGAIEHYVVDEIDAKDISSERLAVYGFDMQSLEMAPDVTPVMVAGSTSPNLRAQGGSFLLVAHHGTMGEMYAGGVSLESRLPDVVPMNLHGEPAPFLIKVTIPAVLAAEVLQYCRKHGVSAATMFPGYDGAAKAVLEWVRAKQFYSKYESVRTLLRQKLS